MNNVDPEAWLTWVLERVADHGLTPSTNLCRGTGSPKTSKTRPDRTDTLKPLLADLEAWLRDGRPRLSRSSSVAGPLDYMRKRRDGFAGFIDDGRICLTDNAAGRGLRGFALGRKSWLFAGTPQGRLTGLPPWGRGARETAKGDLTP